MVAGVGEWVEKLKSFLTTIMRFYMRERRARTGRHHGCQVREMHGTKNKLKQYNISNPDLFQEIILEPLLVFQSP